MKLLLVRPKIKKDNHYCMDFYINDPITNKRKYVMAPPSLGIIASLTPKKFDVKVVDENIEPINFYEKPDLVGIAITSFSASRGYEIADEFRKRSVKVVFGGIHTSVMPKEALKHADSIVIGEAEGVWSKLIKDFSKNKLKRVYRNKKRPSLQNLPFIRWNLIQHDKYLVAPFMITRGCPYMCEFCVVGEYFGRIIRAKPIDKVVKELSYLKKHYKYIMITDNNLLLKRTYAKTLFKRIVPLKLTYFCYANASIYKDKEILELMKKSGCTHVVIGFETLNGRNLEVMKKDATNKFEEYGKAIADIQNHGIMVRGLFMIGNDFDDETVKEKIIEFVEKNNLVVPLIFRTGAYCGSRFFKRLRKERTITEEEEKLSKDKGTYLFFKPKLMTYEKLNQVYTALYNHLYSPRRFYKRLLKFLNTKKSTPSEERIGLKELYTLLRVLLNRNVGLFVFLLIILLRRIDKISKTDFDHMIYTYWYYKRLKTHFYTN